jgi:hypothetical protein
MTGPRSEEDLTTEITELHGKEIQSNGLSIVILPGIRFFPFRVFPWLNSCLPEDEKTRPGN